MGRAVLLLGRSGLGGAVRPLGIAICVPRNRTCVGKGVDEVQSGGLLLLSVSAFLFGGSRGQLGRLEQSNRGPHTEASGRQ